jgi:hypothetical protein
VRDQVKGLMIILGGLALTIWLDRRDQQRKTTPETGVSSMTLQPPSEEEHRSHREQHWRRQLMIEWGTLISAVLAFLAAAYSAWIFQGQLKEMRDQDRA